MSSHCILVPEPRWWVSVLQTWGEMMMNGHTDANTPHGREKGHSGGSETAVKMMNRWTQSGVSSQCSCLHVVLIERRGETWTSRVCSRSKETHSLKIQSLISSVSRYTASDAAGCLVTSGTEPGSFLYNFLHSGPSRRLAIDSILLIPIEINGICCELLVLDADLDVMAVSLTGFPASLHVFQVSFSWIYICIYRELNVTQR